GRERGRLDALHVPGMEILVTCEPEESPVALADLSFASDWQVVPRAKERGRGAMLEAPVALPERGDEEHVAPHRRRHAEESYVVLAQSLQGAREPRQAGSG